MPKIYEMLDLKALAKLKPEVEEALLSIHEYREQDNSAQSMRFVLPAHWERAIEVGEPIIRYVHGRMFFEAQPRGGLPFPYTHVWRGYISQILATAAEGIMTDDQMSKLAGQVARILRSNQLAERIGKGKTKDWNMRSWPPGLTIDVGYHRTMTRRQEAELDSRIQEVGEAPVKTSYDLSAVKIPDKWTPDTLIEYVEELKTCFNRLKKAHQELEKAYDEQAEEMKALADIAHRKVASEWEEAGDRIKEIVLEDWRETRGNQYG